MTIERPPQEAVALLEKAVSRSKRSLSVRLPQEFARDRASRTAVPPLAGLLQGGGEVRIKVLLTVLMMATKPPHMTRVSSKDLAAMLGLSDPDGAGARRVSKAFVDLERANLVKRDREPGHVPTTLVLNPDGTGGEWSDRELEHGYITLTPNLWRRGWLIALSGRAIALLIILREFTNGRNSPMGAYVDGIRKRQYGLSDDTWTKATKELCEAGLLTIRESITTYQGEPRRRNLYSLHLDRLTQYDPGGFPSLAVGGESR